MSFNLKLKKAMASKKISKEEIANILNITIETVDEWENGTLLPNINDLIKLSDILNVSLDYLLKDENLIDNDEIENDSFLTESNKKIISSYKKIKIWSIIGTILTPLSLGGNYLNDSYNSDAYWFFLIYIISIPVCIFGLKALREAKSKSDVTKWGIAFIFIVSIVGGIMMLNIPDSEFEGNSISYSNNVIDETKKIKRKERINECKYKIENFIKKPIVLILSIILVVGVVLGITIPKIFDSYNNYSSVEEETEREKAWDKIYDDLYLYKSSDTSYSKTIYSGVSNYFDKQLKILITNNKKESYQIGDIYFRASGHSWIDEDTGAHSEFNIGIAIQRNSENQSEFVGKCYLYFYDDFGTSDRYLYSYADCRHLKEYSIESPINLYNIQVYQNNTKGLTNQDVKELIADESNLAMKECLKRVNDYLINFYNIEKGISIFGFECLE